MDKLAWAREIIATYADLPLFNEDHIMMDEFSLALAAAIGAAFGSVLKELALTARNIIREWSPLNRGSAKIRTAIAQRIKAGESESILAELMRATDSTKA